MNLTQLLASWRASPDFMQNVTSWREVPARPAVYADFPPELDARIALTLQTRGITRLYSHQAQAIGHVLAGRDIVVVTPTASGKTLCYNLPVLNAITKNPDARALYLFPTKALSADQTAELYEMITALGQDIKAFTYDGDTPASARRAVRQAGHVVVTNPDMLHAGILPHHTKWVKLFDNLKYVVIDEIHAYRGAFGSNLANVLRRLLRICDFYGAKPQFICCSATIANPQELASQLIGRDITLVDQNGAPSGARHVIFYNPPVVNAQLGIRKGSVPETRALASKLIQNDIQTIVFARSRLIVEVLVRYFKELVRESLGNSGRVRGYRSGYLPTRRREIEQDLRAGKVTGVVSTNALELGIDIGQLDACVLCGYPGTIASTWQQAGRAGRRREASLMLLVASSSPLDQFIVTHPQYFFDQSPEHAQISPDNLYILLNHFKCAAYELPFEQSDKYGGLDSTGELLSFLTEQNILHKVGDRYHWMAEEHPQAMINLRAAADQNFLIIDITNAKHRRVIGEMDRYAVPMLLHQYAIYMQEGKQYQVEELDFDDKKAYVREVDVDYYTDANLVTSLKVLDVFRTEQKPIVRSHGEVLVSSMVTLFKKIKFDTHENLGWGPVTLPELEMHTTACWWQIPESAVAEFTGDQLQGALLGLANLIRQLAPLYLMCGANDIAVHYHARDPFTAEPSLYLYDTCAGGIGLSDKVYEMELELFRQAATAIEACPCESGCPSCVGPPGEAGMDGKRVARAILGRILRGAGIER